MSFAGPLDILILHFNRPGLLATTLQAIGRAAVRDAAEGRINVWILDNGSEPEQRDQARAAIDAFAAEATVHVQRCESPENQGFARGMNMLWRLACPTAWVLFLNSDTELAEDFFVKLREALPAPDAKVFASPIVEESGRRYWGGRLELWRAIARMTPANRPGLAFASGSALLVPAPLLPRTGPWNEAFFFYGEDVELCVRLRREGWTLLLLPMTVRHLGRGSLDRERAVELHFRGRGTLIGQLPIHPLRRRLIGGVVRAELAVRSMAWSLRGQRQLARAAWRGWRQREA